MAETYKGNSQHTACSMQYIDEINNYAFFKLINLERFSLVLNEPH